MRSKLSSLWRSGGGPLLSHPIQSNNTLHQDLSFLFPFFFPQKKKNLSTSSGYQIPDTLIEKKKKKRNINTNPIDQTMRFRDTPLAYLRTGCCHSIKVLPAMLNTLNTLKKQKKNKKQKTKTIDINNTIFEKRLLPPPPPFLTLKVMRYTFIRSWRSHLVRRSWASC